MKILANQLQQLYEIDYYEWLEKTVLLLKEKQFNSVDWENLIEEIESLGRSDKNAAESYLLRIIIHLLYYQYWEAEKAFNANHWKSEIRVFRFNLNRKLTTNLKNYLLKELTEIYRVARNIVMDKSDLSPFMLPEICPYTIEQLLDENWLPNQ